MEVIFVEDGSVDIEELKKITRKPVVVYRQGAREPMVTKLMDNVTKSQIENEQRVKDLKEFIEVFGEIYNKGKNSVQNGFNTIKAIKCALEEMAKEYELLKI